MGFTREGLEERARRLWRLAMNLLAFGALGAILGHAGGAVVQFMPPGPNGTGSASDAALVLESIPAVLMAAGLGMLGMMTGATRYGRAWPWVFAAVFAASTLCAMSLLFYVGWSTRFSRWVQPAGWGPMCQWVRTVTACSLPAVGAAVMLRMARHERALARLAEGVRGAAVLALVFTVAGDVQVWIGAMGRGTAVAGTFWNSWELGNSLHFLGDLCNGPAWIGLTLGALVARAVCGDSWQGASGGGRDEERIDGTELGRAR